MQCCKNRLRPHGRHGQLVSEVRVASQLHLLQLQFLRLCPHGQLVSEVRVASQPHLLHLQSHWKMAPEVPVDSSLGPSHLELRERALRVPPQQPQPPEQS